jgi:hypothetical protein
MHNGDDNFFIYDNDEGATRLYIDDDGRVGIGTIPPTSWNNSLNVEYKLYVSDGIATRDVKVQATGWPDYVFDTDYQLMSIADLERYIREHKRLPGMKSARQIEGEDGFKIGEQHQVLLQKVEEQALYIIELKHQLDDLKALLNRLEGKSNDQR